MAPLELCTKHLEDYTYSLLKSKNSFDNGMITEEVHNTHKRNLTKLIKQYETAVMVLKNHEKVIPHKTRVGFTRGVGKHNELVIFEHPVTDEEVIEYFEGLMTGGVYKWWWEDDDNNKHTI